MEGRIGGPPVNGCQAASGARFGMASPSRDRVTIDLRGIGDAVRVAAASHGMGVAQLVRRGIVMSLDLRTMAVVAAESDGQTPAQAPTRETTKLTLRLPQAHADALVLNAVTLGLSYGEYVARLVDGSRLPQPLAERQADRAALLQRPHGHAVDRSRGACHLASPIEGGAGQAVPGSLGVGRRRDSPPP
jgi:hypothetical protein